jgi:8-oxo-dGTP pyrophosphatase MutT (NUDIX family)
VASKASRSIEEIRRRLAAPRAAIDPRARILANVAGPASAALLAAIDVQPRPASVLLTLLERPEGLTVLFTERAAHLRNHAGQISFPGGRVAPGESAVEAALREAHEEVGIRTEDVDVLGTLDVLLTGTGFSITPIVGAVTKLDFEPLIDPSEVASVFEVPLDYVLDETNIATAWGERFGTRFRTLELHYGGHSIWGATAAMLNGFRELIVDERPPESTR